MMGPAEMLNLVPWVVGGAIVVSLAGIVGWVHNTRFRIRHGYPLEGMWGQSLGPSTSKEAEERIRLLTQENAQLHAEVGSMKDRLANVERIVTDSGYTLHREIDQLRRQGEVL